LMLERVYSLFRLPGEPQMTRFLAEQLAMSHWFSIAKAEKILSYSPTVSTPDGVDSLVEWLCRQNCLGKEK
jgi:nucleoside-diphosphate-sugar epimerase